jgi:hypothetical protein
MARTRPGDEAGRIKQKTGKIVCLCRVRQSNDLWRGFLLETDGAPGRLSHSLTTNRERNLEIAAQCSGLNFRAAEGSGRAGDYLQRLSR